VVRKAVWLYERDRHSGSSDIKVISLSLRYIYKAVDTSDDARIIYKAAYRSLVCAVSCGCGTVGEKFDREIGRKSYTGLRFVSLVSTLINRPIN